MMHFLMGVNWRLGVFHKYSNPALFTLVFHKALP